jgi:hypothetical protein
MDRWLVEPALWVFPGNVAPAEVLGVCGNGPEKYTGHEIEAAHEQSRQRMSNQIRFTIPVRTVPELVSIPAVAAAYCLVPPWKTHAADKDEDSCGLGCSRLGCIASMQYCPQKGTPSANQA